MKTTFIGVLILVVIAACTPKASPSTTEALIPTEDKVSKTATTIEAGEVIFTTKCTKCHKAKDEAVASKTFEELRPILASMSKKARLNSEEVEQVSAYVFAHSKK